MDLIDIIYLQSVSIIAIYLIVLVQFKLSLVTKQNAAGNFGGDN